MRIADSILKPHDLQHFKNTKGLNLRFGRATLNWLVVLPDIPDPRTIWTFPMQPIQVISLKSACIQRLEELILSGEWQIDMRLPSERDLAAQLSVSRPVLHEAFVDLAAKGLVTIEPRRGVFINDYRTSGSCTLLSSLLSFSGGKLDPAFIQSLLEMRLLIEEETARLAALHRSALHLAQFAQILEREKLASEPIEALTELDFSFHLLIAVASSNLVYPLILNSFRIVYTQLTGQFFRHYSTSPVLPQVYLFHRRLVAAIEAQQPNDAGLIMKEMLQHGAVLLSQFEG
jgi:DNA-binding FadR family transcriptional regulator